MTEAKTRYFKNGEFRGILKPYDARFMCHLFIVKRFNTSFARWQVVLLGDIRPDGCMNWRTQHAHVCHHAELEDLHLLMQTMVQHVAN